MIRSLLNFLAMCGFVGLLPFFLAASYLLGSKDEQWLMRAASCLFGPCCLVIWYIAGSHLIFKRRASYLVQFLIFVAGYGLVALAIRSGVLER